MDEKMTVRKLIQELSQYDLDFEVVTISDRGTDWTEVRLSPDKREVWIS